MAKRITQSLPKTVHATFPSFRLLTHFVESVGREDVLGLVLKSWLSKIHPTKGWDYDLGIRGLKIFFANNGLGGFLGPKWKVLHHGTLRNHFQGLSTAFRSRPGGEKMAKIR